MAECQFKNPKKVSCLIKVGAGFEDGSLLTPQDFVLAFQRFINPKPRLAYQAGLLLPIKNAHKIYHHQASVDSLGVKPGSKKNELIIELEQSFPEFLEILSNPLLTAYRTNEAPSATTPDRLACGPFKIKSWEPHKKIELVTNQYFPHKKNPTPLIIELQVIDDDNFVLQSFENKKIDWVRQLPVHLIARYQSHPSFITQDQIRLDSLFFDKRSPLFNWAPAMAHAIDYESWGKVFAAKPRPGCFGLPHTWTGQPVCYPFDPTQAQKLSQRLVWPKEPTLLHYSKSGSSDHNRSMEFLQSQWQTHLKQKVELEPLEGKIFIERVNQNQLSFFRKGLSPERATCLAILELFALDPSLSPGQSELWRSQFSQELQSMSPLKTNSSEYKKLCHKNLLKLQTDLRLIPTGPIYFSYLLNPRWQGLRVDSLNRIDFTNLRLVKTSTN